jgi:membrane-associated phospholipid phosphatase
MIKTITELGDPALLLLSAAILFLALLATGQRAAARGWALSITLCVAMIVVAKLGSEAWGDALPALHVRSPSGHIALSSVFYGGVTMLFVDRRPLRWRLVAWPVAVIIIVAIATTRFVLGLHTPEEILVAFVIGGVSFVVLGATKRRMTPVALPWLGLACLFALLAIITHGRDLTAEPAIIHVARQLQQWT